jgi:hypothetical protein
MLRKPILPTVALIWSLQLTIHAAPPLKVDYVTSFPLGTAVTNIRTTQLDNRIILTVGAGANRKLYSFNGVSVSEINDPYVGSAPDLNVTSVLNGSLYYTGNSGTKLFKTDGFATQFVADVDSFSSYTADNYVFTTRNGPNGRELRYNQKLWMRS